MRTSRIAAPRVPTVARHRAGSPGPRHGNRDLAALPRSEQRSASRLRPPGYATRSGYGSSGAPRLMSCESHPPDSFRQRNLDRAAQAGDSGFPANFGIEFARQGTLDQRRCKPAPYRWLHHRAAALCPGKRQDFVVLPPVIVHRTKNASPPSALRTCPRLRRELRYRSPSPAHD
jgi:hypothetical protein